MSADYVINVDLADVWQQPDRKKLIRTLAWGDQVSVVKINPSSIEVEFTDFETKSDGTVLPRKTSGFIKPTASSKIKPKDIIRPADQNEVMRVNFVDVQQGDGSVIESPEGKVILVDGGDNQLFARYLAGRFRNTSANSPKKIACILVTHGDADHFAGLPEILKSEKNKEPRKRLFIQPERYFHNGIVKRPGTTDGKKTPDQKLLGPTVKQGKDLYLTGLVDNILDVDGKDMNKPFQTWTAALKEYDKRSPLTDIRRLEIGDDQAFSFFNTAKYKIEVLGPITKKVGGKPALKFLGNPPTGVRAGDESLGLGDEEFTGYSASHTINGHSIVFRLTYGAFSFLFSGDLNDEASRFLATTHKDKLRSEVFKVPHHGSADFSGNFIQCVSPIVSLISSGDESARKEYMHPRATLVGALGKHSRVPEPLIFVTELVAFFQMEGWSKLAHPDTAEEKKRGEFFAFSRAAFGIIKTRTDGKRLLVYTDSGNVKMKEAYAYKASGSNIQPTPVLRA